MTRLSRHHKFQIPNALAVFAALLLLITSVVGYESSQNSRGPGQDITNSMKANSVQESPVTDTVEYKRRGLNLGLPLFRRG